jgi:hypothetical protein
MNDDNKEDKSSVDDSMIDENMSLFIFGNIKIRDVDTGEVLVNQRF